MIFTKKPQRRSLERRLNWIGRSAAIIAALSVPFQQIASANTQVVVIGGNTDLTAGASYVGGSVPGTGNDLVFNGLYNPAAFTVGPAANSLSIGTLDDFSPAAITISGQGATTSTLTLNGGVDSVVNSQPGDLLYVGTGDTLTIQNGTGTLGLTLAAGGNFDVQGTATISSAITDGGHGLVKSGAGTLTLSGLNTASIFTGPLTVNGGTLSLTGSIGSSVLNVGGGTFAYSPAGTNTEGFTATNINTGASIINNTVSTDTLALGNIVHGPNGEVEFATTTGKITTGSTTGDGTGILAPWAVMGALTTLTYVVPSGAGTNIAAYTAGTAMPASGAVSTSNYTITTGGQTMTAAESANTLQVLNSDVTAITLANGGNSLTTNGILNSGGNNGSFTYSGTGALVIGANKELDLITNNQSTFINSAITDSAGGGSSVAITSYAGNGVFFGGTNTYTGGTVVNLGKLNISAGGQLGTGGVTILGGGTLVDTNGSANANAANALGGAGNTIILGGTSATGGAATFAYAAGGSIVTLPNPFNIASGTGFAPAIQNTSGIVTLSGLVTLANNLTLFNNNSAGGSNLTLGGGITGSGNLLLNAAAGGGAIQVNAGTVNFSGTFDNISSSTATITVSANLTGAESFLQNSTTSTTTVSGSNTNTGAAIANLGTLEFTKEVSLYDNQNTGAGGQNWSTSNIIVNPGGTLAVQVGGAGNFTSADIAALNALGSNTGGFEAGSFLGIDTGGGTTTYSGNGGVLTNSPAGPVGLNKLGSNSLILTAAQTYTGPTIISAGTLQLGTNTAGQDASLASSSIADGGTLLFEPSSAVTDVYNGSIAGGGAVTINGNAAGTVRLTGSNTYTGATAVTSGTLDVANQYALQNSTLNPSNATDVTFDSSVASNAFTVGSLGSQNLALQNTAGAGITLTIGSYTNANTVDTAALLAPTVSGTGGALTVFGYSNSVTLEGANTYTGPTTVLAGTLNLGGATANGSISSGSPLILGGIGGDGTLAYTRTGTVAQTFNGTTINEGGNAVTESTSTQTVNLGSLTDNAGGTVDLSNVGTITTTTGNTNGIIGGFATYGNRTTWAVAPATPGGAITGLSAGSYQPTTTALNTPSAYGNQNVDVVSSQVLTGPISPNTLRFNTNGGYTLTLTGLNTVISGGILVTGSETSAASTITGGFLTGSPGGQLAVSVGSTVANALTIVSQVEDNGSPTAVTLSSNNSTNRELYLNNANNSFSGGMYINGSGVSFASGGTALGTGNVYFGSSGNVFQGTNGAVAFGATNLTSGLLVDDLVVNFDNGDFSSNGGAGTWTLEGVGSATFNGYDASYAGGRVVNLVLDSGTQILGGSVLGSASLTVNGGTLQLGNGYGGTVNGAGQNVQIIVGGGTFQEFGVAAGTTSQTFAGGLAVNSGASTVAINSNNGAGTVLNLTGAITRSVGGTVNFTLPAADGGVQDAINGILTTTVNTNGIIGGYATVNGTDWAFNAGPAGSNTLPGFTAGSSYPNGSNIIALPAANYTNDAWGVANQTTVTANDSPASGSTTNSLRFNASGANTVTLAGVNTITSGGILVTNNVGANVTTISGGSLEGSNSGDLIVIQNNTGGGLTINSTIVNNTGATGLTKSGPGLLTLNPSTANTFTGGIYLNGGILNTTQNGIGAAGSFAFNGGTLQAAGAISTSKAVTIGINGATIDTNGNTVSLTGNVTKDGGNEFNGAGALGGFVNTGVGSLTKTGVGTLTLGGAADTFGGGIIINNGTVQDGNAAAGTLGTGYVTFASNGNASTLDLNGNSATIAGLIGAGTNGLVTSGGAFGSTSTLTLDGVYGETYGGAIQDGINGGLVALTENLNNSTETVTLLGNNTYSGPTTVNSGILQVGNGSTGAITKSAFTVSGTGTLGFDEANGSTVSGAITNNGSVVGDQGAGITNTLAGAIGGTGSFTQTGRGTTILSNNNSYSGPTTVAAGGHVIVSGSLSGTASVSAGNGASLEVDGLINPTTTVALSGASLLGNNGNMGTVNANSGSNIAPGFSPSGPLGPGTLTASNVNYLDTASSLTIRIGVLNGSDNDQLAITGGMSSLSLNNTPLNIMTGTALNASDIGLVYVIVKGGAFFTGSGADEFTYAGTALGNNAYFTTPSGYTFQVFYGTDDNPADGANSGFDVALELTAVAAVPEPGTWGMILSGVGMLALLRRRRRTA